VQERESLSEEIEEERIFNVYQYWWVFIYELFHYYHISFHHLYVLFGKLMLQTINAVGLSVCTWC
jgi:hypothetical protein